MAEFLHNEVPGMQIPLNVRKRIKKAFFSQILYNYTSYFTTPTHSSTCPDMHLFMGSTLPWEWNIATGGQVY